MSRVSNPTPEDTEAAPESGEGLWMVIAFVIPVATILAASFIGGAGAVFLFAAIACAVVMVGLGVAISRLQG